MIERSTAKRSAHIKWAWYDHRQAARVAPATHGTMPARRRIHGMARPTLPIWRCTVSAVVPRRMLAEKYGDDIAAETMTADKQVA